MDNLLHRLLWVRVLLWCVKVWLQQVRALPHWLYLTFPSFCPRWFSVWMVFSSGIFIENWFLFYLILPSASVRMSTWHLRLSELVSEWCTDKWDLGRAETFSWVLYVRFCMWLFASPLWSVMDASLHHRAEGSFICFQGKTAHSNVHVI